MLNRQTRPKRLGQPAFYAAAGLVLLLAFLLPALINRAPIIYPDSVGYYHAGYAALQSAGNALGHAAHSGGHNAGHTGEILSTQNKDGVSAARSVYYGLIYCISMVGGEWLLPIMQIAITASAMGLALNRVAPQTSARIRLALMLALVLFTGLNVFTITVMPDVFAGLILVGLGVLLTYADDLPLLERLFWLAIVMLGCLFHKGHVAIAIVTLAFAAAAALVAKVDLRRFILPTGAVIAAAVALMLVGLVVRTITKAAPMDPPFLLARVIGDGTAQPYLTKHCPTQHFVTCQFLGSMPMTENEFLWSGSNKPAFGTAPNGVRIAILAEANKIVVGVAKEYPLQQMKASATNFARQLGLVGVSEFSLSPQIKPDELPGIKPTLAHYQTSGIRQGRMPLWLFSDISALVYFISLGSLAILFAKRLWASSNMASPADQATTRFAAVLVFGLISNALVNGILSGVFDRYQGRVAWLAPLALIAMTVRTQRTAPICAPLR